jgi:hypothetical protein
MLISEQIQQAFIVASRIETFFAETAKIEFVDDGPLWYSVCIWESVRWCLMLTLDRSVPRTSRLC